MKMMMMLLISALLASGEDVCTSPRGRAGSACACSDPNPCQHDNDGSCLSTIECSACCATPGGCAPGVSCVGYVVGGPTSQDACCTAGTTHCGPAYTLMKEALSWSDANAACLAAGMELASVHSDEENALLLTAAAGNTVWIGGTEDAASQGTWVWSPSGTPLSYKNWATGMPDNQGGMQDCLAFNYQLYYTNTGKWDDQDCTATQYYVCQIPL